MKEIMFSEAVHGERERGGGTTGAAEFRGGDFRSGRKSLGPTMAMRGIWEEG